MKNKTALIGFFKYKRIFLFTFLWLVAFPIFFHINSQNFHLSVIPHFTYPMVITPVIFFILYIFNRKDIEAYKFSITDNEWHKFLFVALIFLTVYLKIYDILTYLFQNRITLPAVTQLILVYGTLSGLYFSLFLAIFGRKFTTQFRYPIIKFCGFNLLYYGLFLLLFPHWGIFSKTTTIAVFYLLKIFFPQVRMLIEGNNVGLFLNEFSVGIGESCSGVMFILLFVTLYGLFCFIKPKAVKPVSSLLLFSVGAGGAFILNIIRVFFLMIIGTKNPRFAIGLFHDNASWILFVGYFLIYLTSTYPLIIKTLSKKITAQPVCQSPKTHRPPLTVKSRNKSHR
jgi:exosortase/archaeosortase family protein